MPNCVVVDEFIDDLIEGVETNLPVSRHPVDVSFAIQQEYETRQLPPMKPGRMARIYFKFL